MLFSLCRILISTESKRVIVVAILLVWYSSASSSHAVAEDAAMLETIEGMDSLYSSGLSVRGKLTKSVEGSNDPPEISLLEYTCRFGQKSLRLVPESPTIPSREGALSVAKRLVPGYKPRGDGINASGIGEEAIVFHDGRSVVVRSIPVFKYRDDADKPQQLPSTAIRDVQDQDSYAFTLLPLVVELGLGRGFTRRFEEVPHVALNNKTADAGSGVEQIGVVTVVADGFGLAPIDKGTWTLELDSRAAYLARSASFSSDKGAGLVIKTSGDRSRSVHSRNGFSYSGPQVRTTELLAQL